MISEALLVLSLPLQDWWLRCFDRENREGRDATQGPDFWGSSLHCMFCPSISAWDQGHVTTLLPQTALISESWGRMYMESSGQLLTSLDTLKTLACYPGWGVGSSSACCPLSRPRLPLTTSPQPKPASPRPLVHSPLTIAASATSIPRMRRTTTWTKKLLVFMLSGRCMTESWS